MSSRCSTLACATPWQFQAAARRAALLVALILGGLAVRGEAQADGVCGTEDATVVPCTTGVHDCCYTRGWSDDTETCSTYTAHQKYEPKRKNWILVAGAVIAMAMAYAIGSNDSANAWGTSVGSGAVSLRRACLMGGLGEFLGATSLGAGVSGTIQKGVARPF